ncbi:MAG: murein biosynthesis integral membrane protein MurJ, partial [Defluviitaleaceae bacterium]|nr:murein biosynthesis integral membrane protein MurJ [Defluviitaleaceae bacterium]
AFILASTLPRMITDAMFAAAITASFIPVFTGQLQRGGKEKAFVLASNFLSIVLTASVVVTACAMLLAPLIVGLGAADFAPYYADLTVALLRIMLPLIVISCAAFTFVGVLQSFGQFYIPAAMSLVANGVIIAYYVFFFDSFGVFGLAVVFLLGWASQLAIQLPFLKKYGYRYSFTLDFKAPGISEISKLIAPAMVFVWVLPINLQVNIFSVTHIVGGGVAIGLSNTVYTIVTGIFVLSVANVIFPKLSRLAADADEAAIGATLLGAMKGLLYLLIPITVGLVVVAPILVHVLFLHGEFTLEGARLTWVALRWFAVGIVGFGMQNVLARGFFAYRDGRTPLMAGVAAVAINAAISIGLVGRLGVAAPALGSSVAMTVCAVMLFAVMYTRNPAIWDKRATLDILKMLVCALAMGFAAHNVRWNRAIIANAFPDGIVVLAAVAAGGALAYLALTYVLQVSEARMIVDAARSFLKRKARP